MEVEYRRTIKQSFMIITSERVLSDYRLEMCTRNRMEGLLEFETVVADGRLQFWYDITGKQSLEEYVKTNKIEEQLLRILIASVGNLAGVLWDYLLEEQDILLDVKSIYIESTNHKVYFCYLPEESSFEKRALSELFRQLMEYLLTRIEHSDKQAVAVAYETYQMTLQSDYSIEKICKKVSTVMASSAETIKMEKINRKTAESLKYETDEGLQICDSEAEYQGGWLERNTGHIKDMAAEVEEKEAFWKLLRNIRNLKSIRNSKILKNISGLKELKSLKRTKNQRQQMPLVFEPEEAQSREEVRYTVFLGERSESECAGGVLKYCGIENNRNLVIAKTPYHIGSREDADGVINKRGISRMHARITKEDNEYYIEDLNSKNGTWVDGGLLNYQDKVPLKFGSRVLLAEEEYIFSFHALDVEK